MSPSGSHNETRLVSLLGLALLFAIAVLASHKATAPQQAPPSSKPEHGSSPSGLTASPETATTTPEPGPPHSAATTQQAISSTGCHELISLPPGWLALERCFEEAAEAQAIVRRLRAANVHATTSTDPGGRTVIRYQPLSEAEARSAGKQALTARRPQGSDLYQLEVKRDPLVNSFTWQVSMPCPEDWLEAGSFKLTAYVLAQEDDFATEPRIEDPCGLSGNYSKPFLFGDGVRMQGSGLTNQGEVVHFKGNNCFEILDCPRTASTACAKSGRTVAVDPRVISLGSKLLIEDIGHRVAEDTGGAIRGQHIDVYYGTELRLRQAWSHTREDRKVCVAPTPTAG